MDLRLDSDATGKVVVYDRVLLVQLKVWVWFG